MIIDQLLQLFGGNIALLVIKVFLLIIIFLYGIFAAVVLRQIQLMNKIVTEVGFSTLLTSVAVLHFTAVVIVFILAMVLI